MCSSESAYKTELQVPSLLQDDPSLKCVSQRLLWVSVRTSLNNHDGGVVDGLHNGGETAAQVMGLVDVDLWRVFKHHCLS